MIKSADDHAAAADALRARLAALDDAEAERPTLPTAPPDDLLDRIRASLKRSKSELASIRADIESAAAAREAAPMPTPREPIPERRGPAGKPSPK